MAELTFSLAYAGPALEDGTMDIGTLAPALIALGDLFRTANAVLNKDSSPVTLRINATSRGSFEVHLLLSQPDVLSQVVSMFTDTQATAVANLYSIVAGIGGGTAGLFTLIKWIAGRVISKRQAVNFGSIRIELQGGDIIIVPTEVLALYESLPTRRDAAAVVAPLNAEGIDSMELRRTSTQVSVRIEKGDVPSFVAPSLPTITLSDTTTEMHLQMVAVSFHEGNTWRFTDGNQTYSAVVKDPAFLERVASSEEAFRSGDLLRVAMRVHQERANDGSLKTSYAIEHVLEHVACEPHRQLSLDPTL